MRCQVFFRLGLASYLFQERISLWKFISALIFFSGLVVVAFHAEGNITVWGLVFTILASFSWSVGNVVSEKNWIRFGFCFSGLGKLDGGPIFIGGGAHH